MKAEAESEVNYLLDNYIMILKAERRLASNTLQGYQGDLRKFKQYCTRQYIRDPKALNTQTIHLRHGAWQPFAGFFGF